MARETKTLAERNGNPFGVAYEETPDGFSPVQTVREIESAPTIEARLTAIEEALGGTLTTQLSGSNQDLRGSLAERPAAGPEHKGKTFWDVDNPVDVYVCDGTTWRLL